MAHWIWLLSCSLSNILHELLPHQECTFYIIYKLTCNCVVQLKNNHAKVATKMFPKLHFIHSTQQFIIHLYVLWLSKVIEHGICEVNTPQGRHDHRWSHFLSQCFTGISIIELVEAKNFYKCPLNHDFFQIFTQKKLVELTW